MIQDYGKAYGDDYHLKADGIAHWNKRKVRYGDALAAVAYACGIGSWEEFRAIFPDITPLGKESDGDNLKGCHQLEKLKPHLTRQPKSVLDVGGGRGEVTAAFAWLGVPKVQSIEPHPKALEWYGKAPAVLFDMIDWRGCDARLLNHLCQNAIPYVDWNGLDTVLFVESLEHIPKEAFDAFWPFAKMALFANKGRLVVANWLDYHPLEATGEEHCRRVDDALYAEMAVGGRVVYQKGSHLVVDF